MKINKPEVVVIKKHNVWYRNTWVIVLAIISVPYIGIPWMWRFADFSSALKVLLSVIYIPLIIYVGFSNDYYSAFIVPYGSDSWAARFFPLLPIYALGVSALTFWKFIDSEA